jgi:hypothetical protein
VQNRTECSVSTDVFVGEVRYKRVLMFLAVELSGSVERH